MYKGKCNQCKWSEQQSYPTDSNMCLNKKSEWYGMFHINYNLKRYVDGCDNIEIKS